MNILYTFGRPYVDTGQYCITIFKLKMENILHLKNDPDVNILLV